MIQIKEIQVRSKPNLDKGASEQDVRYQPSNLSGWSVVAQKYALQLPN